MVSAIRESSEALRSLRYTAGNYKNDRAYSYAVNFVQLLELDRELGPGSEVIVPTDESIQWRNLKQDLRRAVYSGRIGGDAPMIRLDSAGA